MRNTHTSSNARSYDIEHFDRVKVCPRRCRFEDCGTITLHVGVIGASIRRPICPCFRTLFLGKLFALGASIRVEIYATLGLRTCTILCEQFRVSRAASLDAIRNRFFAIGICTRVGCCNTIRISFLPSCGIAISASFTIATQAIRGSGALVELRHRFGFAASRAVLHQMIAREAMVMFWTDPPSAYQRDAEGLVRF